MNGQQRQRFLGRRPCGVAREGDRDVVCSCDTRRRSRHEKGDGTRSVDGLGSPTSDLGPSNMAMATSMQPQGEVDDRKGGSRRPGDGGRTTGIGYAIPEQPRIRTSSNASLSPSKHSIPLPKSPQGFSPLVSSGDEPGDTCEQMVMLSAKSLPKGKKLLRDSGFPFGCVVSPLAGRSPVPSTTDEAEFCTTCGAALNLYASLDVNRNTWTCPFCSKENQMDAWPRSFLGEVSEITAQSVAFEPSTVANQIRTFGRLNRRVRT